MPLAWLKDVKKRAVENEREFLSFPELYEVITRNKWNYKTNVEVLQKRDMALMCVLALSGLRISEALLLKKEQFTESKDFIIIKNAMTVKNSRIREEIPLSKHGSAKPFTQAISNYLLLIPGFEDYVFPRASGVGILWNQHISRQRAHRIIKSLTNFYCHYFRGVCETKYGKIFKNPYALKDFMGLRDIRSTEPYVHIDWRDFKNSIKNA